MPLGKLQKLVNYWEDILTCYGSYATKILLDAGIQLNRSPPRETEVVLSDESQATVKCSDNLSTLVTEEGSEVEDQTKGKQP